MRKRIKWMLPLAGLLLMAAPQVGADCFSKSLELFESCRAAPDNDKGCCGQTHAVRIMVCADQSDLCKFDQNCRRPDLCASKKCDEGEVCDGEGGCERQAQQVCAIRE